MIKRCQNEECGRSFTPARRDAKFCSDRCRGQANARRVREAAAQSDPRRVNAARRAHLAAGGLANAR